MPLLIMFFFLFIGLALLIVAAKTIRIVPQSTAMLVERLGRFNYVAAGGLRSKTSNMVTGLVLPLTTTTSIGRMAKALGSAS